MSTQIPLKDTKQGDYVRLAPGDSAPVWVRGEYDRSTRTYTLSRFDDMNRTVSRKGSVLVTIGFTF